MTPTRVPKECGYGNFTLRSRTGSVVVCVAPSPARGSLWHKSLTHRVGLATCLAGVGHTPIPSHPIPPPVREARHDKTLMWAQWGIGQQCANLTSRTHTFFFWAMLPTHTTHTVRIAHWLQSAPLTHNHCHEQTCAQARHRLIQDLIRPMEHTVYSAPFCRR